jgi:16S rRNA (guanine1516-N2)-methyltransferase
MSEVVFPISVMFFDGLEDRASMLAAKLKLPLLAYSKSNEIQSNLALLVSDHGLEIIHLGKNSPGPIKCNFATGSLDYRRLHGGGKNQNLARAIGIKGIKQKLYIIDVTAGLGRDAFILASLGAKVLMLERNDILAALLADGIYRARMTEGEKGNDLNEVFKRMTLINNDSIDYLNTLEDISIPDIVYIDPMFPPRQKSSQVKKEMQLLQRLIGPDEDSDKLLASAKSKARYRVVVKRPIHAKFLSDQEPSYSLKGKSTRYDIYSNKKIPD